MLRVVKKIKQYIKIRSYVSRTISELNRLSDRDLADLGIARSDIERVARSSALRRQFS